MVDELEELMPELKDIGTWPEVGTRRTLDELGRAASEISIAQWFPTID